MLAGFGDGFVDVVVRVEDEERGGTYDGNLEVKPGGVANVPVWVARDGGEAAAYAAVGSDPMGGMLASSLEEEGVESGLVEREGETGVCVSLAEADERTMYTRRGVNDEVSFDDFEPMVPGMEGAEVLFVRGYGLRREPMRGVLIELLERVEGPEVWFNPGAPNLAEAEGVERVLELSDLVVMNEEEAEVLCPGGPRELLKRVEEVVVTRGGDEATAVTAEESASVPPEPVEVVDATGAGDAFAAGYASAYMRGEGIRERLLNGHRLAERAVGRLGAI